MTFRCVLMEQMTSEGSIIKHAKAVLTKILLIESVVSTGRPDSFRKLWSEELFLGGAASSVSNLLSNVEPGRLHHYISALLHRFIATPGQLLLSKSFLICYCNLYHEKKKGTQKSGLCRCNPN